MEWTSLFILTNENFKTWSVPLREKGTNSFVGDHFQNCKFLFDLPNTPEFIF